MQCRPSVPSCQERRAVIPAVSYPRALSCQETEATPWLSRPRDDRKPAVLLSDRRWTAITRKNRDCTEQQLGQTNSTSHLLLIYTFISQTPSRPCKNLPARREINQFGEREGVTHGWFYILSVNTEATEPNGSGFSCSLL